MLACCCTLVQAQNADCINAIPLCSTPNFTFFPTSGPGTITDFSVSSTVSNPTNNPFPPNSGCLKSGEYRPQWLLLTVGNAGMLEFVFGAGNSANPQAGFYDWAMWPYSPATCSAIFNNTLAPVRCCWNASPSGGTGLASSANVTALNGVSGNFEPPLQVNACDQFIICISNYSGINTLVSFQSIGTASLQCNPNCNPNYSVCAGSSVAIVPVNYAALGLPVFSIQPGGQTNNTGTFVVTPSVTTAYTTYITGTNGQNTLQTISAVSIVTVLAQPVLSPTVIQSTCSNSLTSLNIGLTFTPGPAVPSYTMMWNPIPNSFTSATQTSITAFVQAGQYNATVTSAGGCSASTSFSVNPAPEQPVINLSPVQSNYVVTCAQPVWSITALDPTLSYTWSNGQIAPVTGPYAEMTFTSTGTWTIIAVHPVSGCVRTKTFVVSSNTTAPSSTVLPLQQNITCNLTSITNVTAVISPTVNVSHQVYAPQGGVFSAGNPTLAYPPYGVGVYTHCAVNDANGCSTCQTFTVSSNQGFPTFNVVSPQNFTLGCNSTSVAILNIINADGSPSGSPVSYTVLGPGTSSSTPTGTLSGQSTYSITTPGSWTVITKDNNSFCETRVPVSILSRTFAPDISALVPYQVLDCNKPTVVLRGQSSSPNVNYSWAFPGTPGQVYSDSVTVPANFSARNSTVVASYTLIITDNSSTCRSQSIVPIYQNLFLPKVNISSGGTPSLSCRTTSVTLTNISVTGIPPNTFRSDSAVVARMWDAPTPQEPLQFATTYLATLPGTYSMSAKDLNNGCVATGTIQLSDNFLYPVIGFTYTPFIDCGSGIATLSTTLKSAISNVSYTLTPPLGAVTGTLVNKTGIFKTTSTGLHRVRSLNENSGCESSADVIVRRDSIVAGFVASPDQGFAPFTATFSNTTMYKSSTGPQNLSDLKTQWSFANGTRSIAVNGTVNPSSTYLVPGLYRIRMWAGEGPCVDTASRLIVVDQASSIEVPNIFSPNGDKVNDEFFLQTAGISTLDFSITNRWGHQVFRIKSETGNVTWDGRDERGNDCSEGVYFYVLEGVGDDGTRFSKSGTITLVR